MGLTVNHIYFIFFIIKITKDLSNLIIFLLKKSILTLMNTSVIVFSLSFISVLNPILSNSCDFPPNFKKKSKLSHYCSFNHLLP